MQDKFLHLVSVCIKENILKKKTNRHEATWVVEGGFPQTKRLVTTVQAYSDMYLSHWNQMELWKEVFENETVCKFK